MRRDAPASFPLATGLLALACLAAHLASLAPPFAYDRAGIMSGEIWRLWTGHLVHFSTRQLVLDVGMLVVAGWLVERVWGSRTTARVVVLGMPALSLGLLVSAPHLLEYRGVSGIVVLLALAAASAVWERQPRARPGLLLLGLALAVKTLLDALGVSAGLGGLPPAVRVAWQAHLVGAVLGWIAARHCLRRARP